MIREISGVSIPFISMPDFIALSSVYLLTGIYNLIKKPLAWRMALDQLKTMKDDFRGDSSESERELGMIFTAILKALEEQITAIRN
jgi:hypothetical protein